MGQYLTRGSEEVATPPEATDNHAPQTARTRHRGTIFASVREDDAMFHRRTRSLTMPDKLKAPRVLR
jgi:hypothetical protein